MSTIEKWNATGLLDAVADEDKQIVIEALETTMVQVLDGKLSYNDFESKIIELRKQGYFSRNKENE